MTSPARQPKPHGVAATGRVLLTTPIDKVPGMPKARAHGLARLGLTNVGRLIAHLPMRHEFQAGEGKIGSLTPGVVASTRGEVSATRPVNFGRMPRFEAVLVDETGRLDVIWFRQTYLKNRIHAGARLRVQGEVKRRGSALQMINPRWELLALDKPEPPIRAARLRPIYPASEAIKSWEIEKTIEQVLDDALPQIEDHLPDAFRKERNLPELRQAYRMMHRPISEEEVAQARRRLAFDELLLLQLGVFLKRAHLRKAHRAPALKWNEAIDAHIRARFPFVFTKAQDRVIGEIVKDVTRPVPSNRLIQGDVGSGKTAVALYALLMAVADGHQGALLSPTEILAEQHYMSIIRLLKGSKVRIGLLTGAVVGAEREALLEGLATGEIDIVIGTHALLSEGVAFSSLAVAVTDEQHRFGVHQRAQLRVKGQSQAAYVDETHTPDSPRGTVKKSDDDDWSLKVPSTPHVLVMTATPIPRTLGMTLFGDLDISVIDELPPGRKPIVTRLVDGTHRNEAYGCAAERIEAGEQVYVVVPTIDPAGEDLGTETDNSQGTLRSVRSLVDELEGGLLAGKRIGAIHGRLKRETREHIMERFRCGLIDCLVATTVIEVGVDVPNATVMIVEHADRFGLAQLHQLRGRVGRGGERSYCYLVAQPTTDDARQRLAALCETTDGFELAERDLAIRGPGEVFGTRQSGAASLKVADLMADRELLAMARRDARAWIERSPTLSKPEEAVLLRRLLQKYGHALGLGDVG